MGARPDHQIITIILREDIFPAPGDPATHRLPLRLAGPGRWREYYTGWNVRADTRHGRTAPHLNRIVGQTEILPQILPGIPAQTQHKLPDIFHLTSSTTSQLQRSTAGGAEDLHNNLMAGTGSGVR